MSDMISRDAAIAAVSNGWNGAPHQSNMDYGPNVAVKAVAAIRALPAAQVAVKPLVWGEYGRSFCVAETIFGQAAIQNETTALNPTRWGWWAAGSDEDADPTGYADGPDTARAAVQADHDARIRAALEE